MLVKRMKRSSEGLSEKIKNSELRQMDMLKGKELLHAQQQGKTSYEPDILTEVFRLMSSGYLVFNYQDSQLHLSPSLAEMFENCIPDKEITVDILIENIHPEDKPFIQELFASPKTNKKRGTGQFRLFQKTKEYKDIRFPTETALPETAADRFRTQLQPTPVRSEYSSTAAAASRF